MHVGDRIKLLRKEELHKTQKDFGNRIGLKPNSVSDIESGKNNPTQQTIKAICREFNVNVNWILTGNGDIYDIPEDEVAAVVSELLEEDNPFYDLIIGIMKTYQQLDPKSQDALNTFGKALLDNMKRGD